MKLAERYIKMMAAKCRDAYIAERTAYEIKKNKKLAKRKPPYVYQPAPRYDGGEDENGHHHEPVWPKIARFMITHHLDPYFCIRKRFEIARAGSAPWPNQIAVDAYLDIYTGEKEILTQQDVQVAFDLEKQYCRVALTSTRYNREGVSKDMVWKSLLLDDLLEISPLMRYCLARQLGLTKVAELFVMRAMTQYVIAPKTYDVVWGGSIPEDFKEQTDAVYKIVKKLSSEDKRGR